MKSRSGFVPLAIIITVLIAAVGSSIVVAWRTTYFDSILPPTVREFLGRGEDILSPEGPAGTSSPSSEAPSENSETIAEDPTEGWKTYTNTDYGFSFKYPADWVVYPGVVGGLLDHLGNYIVDLASSPKDSDTELVYPVSPVCLRVIYVVGGYRDSSGEFKAYDNAEHYVRNGVLGSYDTGPYEGALTYKIFGGRTWVEVDHAPNYGVMLYTEGTQKGIYAVYLPKDLGENWETVELVVSTLALDL